MIDNFYDPKITSIKMRIIFQSQRKKLQQQKQAIQNDISKNIDDTQFEIFYHYDELSTKTPYTEIQYTEKN